MILDVVFALFAAFGMFCCFYAFVCLGLPRHNSVLLVDCRGIRTCEELWALLWQYSPCPLPRRILLVDCGISPEEQSILRQKYPTVEFCSRSQLASRLELENVS